MPELPSDAWVSSDPVDAVDPLVPEEVADALASDPGRELGSTGADEADWNWSSDASTSLDRLGELLALPDCVASVEPADVDVLDWLDAPVCVELAACAAAAARACRMELMRAHCWDPPDTELTVTVLPRMTSAIGGCRSRSRFYPVDTDSPEMAN